MPTPHDIKTVIGLFRVSTEEQEQEGNSLAAQLRMYEQDCQSYGWSSLDTFSGQETGTALDSRRIVHVLVPDRHELPVVQLHVREENSVKRISGKGGPCVGGRDAQNFAVVMTAAQLVDQTEQDAFSLVTLHLCDSRVLGQSLVLLTPDTVPVSVLAARSGAQPMVVPA